MPADDNNDGAARRLADERRQLHEQAEAHPARKSIRRWREWQVVVGALQRNQAELLALIDAPGSNTDLAIELVQNVRAPMVRDAFFSELFRLLHNYVASVKTLVEHSRNLMSRYKDSDFYAEYTERVKLVTSEPVVPFVQDLRNVLLHDSLPAISVTLRWSRNDGGDPTESFALEFVTSELLSIDRFSAKARRYIEGRGEEKWEVRLTVLEYEQLILDLCAWISQQFDEQHGNEVDDYNRLVAKIQELMPEPPTLDELAAMRRDDSES